MSICVRSAERNFPNVGAELIEVGGGVAAFMGVDSPLSYAIGVGVTAPAGGSEIDEITRFFEARATPPRITCHPFADRELTRALVNHRYAPTEAENVLMVDLREFDAVRDPRIVEARDMRAWSEVSARGFSDGEIPTEEFTMVGTLIASSENVTALEGRDGETIAATAGCDIDGEIAGFFGATTLPEYRNRGWQTAMIRDRAARAIEAGARYGRVTCGIATTSERRFRALGFSVLYTRTLWERPLTH